jgi:DNA-directed RNA polymerase II subunit RPB2
MDLDMEGFQQDQQDGEENDDDLMQDFSNEDSTALDMWLVVRAFFMEKGLVRQQLDSFDQFVSATIMDVLEEAPVMSIKPSPQYGPGVHASDNRYELRFGECKVTHAAHTEKEDNSVTPLYPADARLRNLTYESALLVDVHKQAFNATTNEPDPAGAVVSQEWIGSIPIMVQSAYCRLRHLSDKDKTRFGECVFDQGGYFVINGSEKVVIAQERQAYNRVYCFHKRMPSKLSWVAEIRSQIGMDNKPRSAMSAVMYRRGDEHTQAAGAHGGGQIRVIMPYVMADVPMVVTFRALGFQNDRQVLSHCVYDLSDNDMVEATRPSLEESRAITTTEGARNFIGKRAQGMQEVARDARVAYVQELLQKDLLPHCGTDPSATTRTRKAFFLGYVIHRLLLCAVGRAEEDDRDHFSNKRLDLAGPLIGTLFRLLFYNMSKAMRAFLQKQLDRGKEPQVTLAIKHGVITRGIRYSLATGNWGIRDSGNAPKTGVSQVLNRLTYASSLSHLRRANTPLGREGKQAKPRMLHNTQWGYICPCETPEGGSIGLVKNLALMSYISVSWYL